MKVARPRYGRHRTAPARESTTAPQRGRWVVRVDRAHLLCRSLRPHHPSRPACLRDAPGPSLLLWGWDVWDAQSTGAEQGRVTARASLWVGSTKKGPLIMMGIKLDYWVSWRKI